MATLLLVACSLWIAIDTSRRVARHGASGMTAGMAAMMAAMGTGLTVGYAAGMVWDLGWATLVGVLVGLTHALVMGRRFGPMAALDGAGGGVMGGLMGPMLGVMLLYLPLSLLWIGLLMLGLQAAFSLAGVYLVAAAAGAVGASSGLHLLGRLLGAHNVGAVCCPEEVDAGRLAPPARASARKRHDRARAPAPPRGAGVVPVLVGLLAGAAFVMLVGGLISDPFGPPTPSGAPSEEQLRGSPSDKPAIVKAGPDGVQQVMVNLRHPRYEPALIEVRGGTPVRLTLQAIGEPGRGAVTLVRGLGQRLVVRANQSVAVEFTPDRAGDYTINCSMNMLVPATLRVL